MERDGEKYIERELIKGVKAIGGLCLKIFNPYYRGLPDRLVILPDGITVWVELKTKGKKPTGLQRRAHEVLRQRNQTVLIIDSFDGLANFLKSIGYAEF